MKFLLKKRNADLSIEVCVPASDYVGFRGNIESHWMHGDNPVLCRHRNMADEAYEYASFVSQNMMDITYVLSILPVGSAVRGWCGKWVSREELSNPVTRFIVRGICEIASKIDYAISRVFYPETVKQV